MAKSENKIIKPPKPPLPLPTSTYKASQKPPRPPPPVKKFLKLE
jgi:hypothetical protein